MVRFFDSTVFVVCVYFACLFCERFACLFCVCFACLFCVFFACFSGYACEFCDYARACVCGVYVSLFKFVYVVCVLLVSVFVCMFLFTCRSVWRPIVFQPRSETAQQMFLKRFSR